MKTTCQRSVRTRFMLAKTSLILALIVSLLFVTQAQPVVLRHRLGPQAFLS